MVARFISINSEPILNYLPSLVTLFVAPIGIHLEDIQYLITPLFKDENQA
jgi:hypothetical protein